MGGESMSLQDELRALCINNAQLNRPLSLVIQDFQNMIEADPQIYISFHQMFEQIPNEDPYLNDPSGKPQIRSYTTVLAALDLIIQRAPSFTRVQGPGCEAPISYMLEWPMATAAGVAAFLNPKVNAQFQKVLNVWAKYLSSPDSRYVLTNEPTGWFGEDAMAAMPNFEEQYECDPSTEFHGFRSWDDFFTRRFRVGVRPVEFPTHDFIINQPCEAIPFRIAKNVKATDTFWIKGEPFSLNHMLNQDEYTSQFEGATVYQGYLHSLAYHLYHSPVSGTITKAYVVPGAYYAENPANGFDPMDPMNL